MKIKNRKNQMKNNHNTLYDNTGEDRMISGLVRSVKYRVPEELDNHLTHLMGTETSLPAQQKSRFSFRPVLAATLLVFMAVLTMLIVNKNPVPVDDRGAVGNQAETIAGNTIDEIKTEFEIKNKNIKILWVQKQNFKLRRTEP